MVKKRNPIRLVKPHRRCTKTYKKYTSFKPYLQQDFNSRCGYCDDRDIWDGGISKYQIDHFVPRTKLDQIGINEYANLVYSCFYCNNSKGQDWPSGNETTPIAQNKGYIDPCDSRYDKQFHRTPLGDIVPDTRIGNYMFLKMKLGLRRHAIVWTLDMLHHQIKTLTEVRDRSNLNQMRKRRLTMHITKLNEYFYSYTGILQDDNNS